MGTFSANAVGRQTRIGRPGLVARGDQSLSRAWALTIENTNEKPIEYGVFVAFHREKPDYCVEIGDEKGQSIAGVTVSISYERESEKNGSKIAVAHIGHGDSVWVKCTPGEIYQIGEPVRIDTTTGYISQSGNLATDYIIVRTANDVVEITRAEVGLK